MLASNRAVRLRYEQSRAAACFKTPSFLRAVALFILIGFLATTFYSPSSASSVSGSSSFAGLRIGVGDATLQSGHANGLGISSFGGSNSLRGLMTLAAFLDEESISVSPPITRAPGCSNPAVLCLGETVSAQVVNAPLRADFRERRIQWIAPDGTVPHMWTVDETPENDTYTLETTGAFAQVGTWTVRTVNNRGGGVAVATFEVGDPTQPSVDLALSMTGPATVAANDAVTYVVTLTNDGPDPAANVVLRNPVPANSTFASASPASGFSCITPGAGEGGEIECTAVTLAVGGVPAVFSFTFTANSDVQGGTSVFNLAKVDSSTNEPSVANNIAYVGSNSPESSGVEGPCVLTCRDDVVVTANATQGGNPGRFVSYSAASGSGNCGSISNSPGSGSFFSVTGSPHTVTSNSSEGPSCTFTVTVLDSAPPTISCPANITVTAESGEPDATLPSGPGAPTHTASGSGETVVGVRSDGTPPVYDNEGILVSPAVVVPLTDPYPLGLTSILWTVTDEAGRTASCSQSITVQAVPRDALTITCPANINVTAPSGSCENATVNVGTPSTHPSDSHVTVHGVRSDGKPMYDCDSNGANCTRKTSDLPFPAGDTVITWTATDDVNDSVASCTQTVTVTAGSGSDTTPPVLTVPANVSATTSSSCTAILDDELGAAEASDSGECGGSVTITRSGVPAGFVFSPGTTVITYTATDAAGNTSSGVQLVTVTESPAVPPTINAPADVTAYTGPGATSCGTVVSNATLGTATASDNCPGVTVTRTGVPAGNFFPEGNTTVTYTATDKSGNTTSDQQVVTVVDNTVPVVTAPGPVTLYTGPGATLCGLIVSDLDATLGTGSASDNCPGVGAVTRTGVPAGNTFPLGDSTLTYSATDAHGNTASATQTVTVVDNTPPVVTPPANITVQLPLNSTATSRAVSYPDPATATDNCGGTITFNYTPASGSVFSVGTTIVTVTATDAHANSASATFTVTVLYNFTGFFSPINNLPTLNSANAGKNIPVKFSLSGNKGLDIFATDNPYSVSYNCVSGVQGVDIVETENPGGNTLTYSPDTYHYNWKTEKSWEGTCRTLVVTLNDGSVHTANFKFK